MAEITLPWPPKELSPNARQHWAVLAKAKKAYREACHWQAKAQGARPVQADRLAVRFVFYPPSRRRIDMDNCIARMKAGIDGLADVLRVDDSRWVMSFEMADSIGGMVKVFFAPTGDKTEPSGL
jgi:crossover junction endodeoxyribonuclease RusA